MNPRKAEKERRSSKIACASRRTQRTRSVNTTNDMKTLFLCALILPFGFSTVIAQEPAKKPTGQGTFYQRFFSDEAVAERAKYQGTPAPPKETPQVSWPLYAPGSFPAGQTVSQVEAAKLSTGSVDGQTIYLVGDFRVTAAGGNRAIFRFLSEDPPARVIVEYPSGSTAPAEGSRLTLDETRGLLLRRVARDADGRINLFVRNISQ